MLDLIYILISSTFWPLKNGNSAPIPVGSTGNLRPFQGCFTWCHRCRPTSDPWHVSSRLPLEAAAASQEESVEYPWRPMEIFDYLFNVIGKSKTYSSKWWWKIVMKPMEVTLTKPKESLRLTSMTLSIDKMAIGWAGSLRFPWCFKNPSWRLLRLILSHQKWRKYEQYKPVEVGSLSRFLQGFYYIPGGDRRISEPSTVFWISSPGRLWILASFLVDFKKT